MTDTASCLRCGKPAGSLGERPASTIGNSAADATGQFDVGSRRPELFTKPEQAQAFAATLAVSA